MWQQLFRKKEISPLQADQHLYRVLTGLDLVLLGIGAIIGAGVFVLTGIAAATKAGPAVVLSYAVAGTAAMFAALAYAELAASVGGTGSAYSYAYAGFGEFIAWLIGWNLLLEYALSVSTVAIGWAGYVNNLFQSVHIYLPHAITHNAFDGGVINLLAVLIILSIALLLCIGVRESARFNAVIVFIKLMTIFVFIVIATFHVDTHNWHPFMPFGWQGILNGAALVFFAYIGFDALSTAVEETIEPQRNVPLGIILSLIICTAIYILVSALLTGAVSYTLLDVPSPVAYALLHLGYSFGSAFIAAGAIAGLTSVILVMFYGLSRICLAMSRDGLLPPFIARINMQTRTPITVIVSTGIFMALISGLAPIDRVAELVNIGTLTAFAFVCGGVVMLRKTHPNLPRSFRMPLSPLLPLLGMFACLYLMCFLPFMTWMRFIVWTILGIAIYFLYGMRHSEVTRSHH